MSDFNRSLLSHVPDGFFIPSAPACLPVSPLFFCIQLQHVLNYICKTRIRHNTPAETVLSCLLFMDSGYTDSSPDRLNLRHIRSCIHAFTHAYVHIFTHAYIHTFIHSRIRTSIHSVCRASPGIAAAVLYSRRQKKQNGQKQKNKKNKTDCTMLFLFLLQSFQLSPEKIK